MADPFFFGYGSLVNRATHAYAEAYPARLNGWRRAWRHTKLRPVAFLTAVPDDASDIDGLMAAVPGDDWLALDEREHAYDRSSVTGAIRHEVARAIDVHVYAIPHGKHGIPDQTHPILLSYIDVVLQGYLREFGEAGVHRFTTSTDGWDAPILDDRSAPLYPRHQITTAEERGFVDECLAGLGVSLLTRS